jgi:hypothetical protein
MSKAKRKWDEVAFDPETGEVDVAETIDKRRYDEEGDPTDYEPTAYTAPEQLDKLYALFALATLKLTGAEFAVAAVLVCHANPYSGRCDPGVKRQARITGLTERGVQKAIRKLERLKVLRTGFRFRATNAYHLNWKLLRRTYERAFLSHSDATVTPGNVSSDVTHGRVNSSSDQGEQEFRSRVNGGSPEKGKGNRKVKKDLEQAQPSVERVCENFRRDNFVMETFLERHEPVERPQEVCREEPVASSSGNPKLFDPWKPFFGEIKDPHTLEFYAARMADAEKVLSNRDSSPKDRQEAVMKLCDYSGKIFRARRA